MATYEVTVSAYALDGWVDWADMSVSLDLGHGFMDVPMTEEPVTEEVEAPAGSEGETCEAIDDTGDVATDCDIDVKGDEQAGGPWGGVGRSG